MLTLVARTHLEALEQKQYQLAVDHIFGVQTLPVRVAQYQIAETPEAARAPAGPIRGLSHRHRPDDRDAARGGGRWPHRGGGPGPARDRADRADAGPSQRGSSRRFAWRTLPTTRPASGSARPWPRTSTPRSRACATSWPTSTRRTRVPEPGLSATPGGEAAYRLAIRMNTTIETTPRRGASLRARGPRAHRGREGRDRARRGLSGPPRLRQGAGRGPGQPHLLPRARSSSWRRGQLERAFAIAPRYFGRLPSANCEVAAVEEYREREVPPAFYMPPSADGSRIGPLLPEHLPAAGAAPPQDRRHHLPRGDPGPPLPDRDRDGADRPAPLPGPLGSRMAGAAFVEGWGLYTERLADEMGLYAHRAERLGMLDAQSFRASRLVVDSGLHAFGWSRARAIEFMHERGSLPLVDAEIEVDRYTIWPGQALSYKIGPARDRAGAARGERVHGRPIRPARLPRRGARPRVGAAPHPAPRDPRLGRGGGPAPAGALGRARRARASMRAPERVILAGRFVRLEPIEERHRDDLLAAAAEDPVTFRYMGSDLSVGASAWPAYLADAQRPDYVAWATVDAATGRAIGSTALRRHRARARAGGDRLDLDRALAPAQRGQHRGQAAPARLRLRRAGRHPRRAEDRRAQPALAGGDRAARGAAARASLRRHIRMPDGFIRDTVYFSILAEEWPAVKARLEERLARQRLTRLRAGRGSPARP